MNFKKYLTPFLCLGFSGLIPLCQAAPFSNMIVFGDSLSDIGNMPMSPRLVINQKKPSELNNMTATFYVPVSNPVNLSGQHIRLRKYFKDAPRRFSWPKVTPDNALWAQPMIGDNKRKSRSMLWPAFLMQDLNQKKLLRSDILLPRMSMTRDAYRKLNVNYSVDYAWSSALSKRACAGENYRQNDRLCRFNAVKKSWQRYIKSRTLANQAAVKVPGMLAQVNIFLNDVKSRRVRVDKNTAVFMWIGGNDMSADFSILQKKAMGSRWQAVQGLLGGIAGNTGRAIKKLALMPDHSIHHLYVLTLFNPKWTPRLQHWSPMLQNLSTVLTDIYNAALRFQVWRAQRRYPWMHIQIVPVRTWFDQWATEEGQWSGLFPKKHLKNSCQLSRQSYSMYSTPKQNCTGYLFWNAVHPSLPTQQLMAYRMALSISQST